jgi:hypothetical protein
MKMKKISVLLVLAMLISVFTLSYSSCKKDKEGDTTESKGTVTNDSNKIQYNLAPEDLGEFELDVLTVKSGQWNMHTDFAPTSLSGAKVNEAVYNRNMMVQDLYNATIIAHEDADYYKGTEKLSMDQLTGNAVYEAAYVEGSSVITVITQDLLHNLYDVNELQLDEEWWSQLIKKEATLGSGKYSTLNFIQSNLSLTAFDLTWCVYFNKTLQSQHELDDFYDMVKNNQWTVETMQAAAKTVANVNGDDSFVYREDGASVYGITTYWNGVKAMLDGCNVQFVTTDENDEIVPNIDNERFVNLAQDLANLCASEGVFTTGGPSTDGKTNGNASDYIKIFNANRALFCVAEVKSSVSDFNAFQGEFGILPLPKYNTAQTEYRSWVNYLAPVLVIPTSSQGDTLHKTALLLDVLSFYSERDVLPEYYDVVLKGRGAKDAQSVEMLDYINGSKSFDASIAYGWSRQFSEVLSGTIQQGVSDVSSLIGTYNDMIKENIAATMEDVFKD